MKKFMAFVFGLLVAFVPFFGSNVNAVGPTNERAVVCGELRELMHKVLYNGRHPSHKARIRRRYTAICARPFSDARRELATDLEKKLKAKNPELIANHQIFASYAFEKFDNAHVPCFYLRTVFKGDKNMEHDVVLLPQVDEYFGNYWYVCDFYEAINEKDEKYLFMPLMEYIDEMNRVNSDSLEGLAIINKDSKRPMLGDTGDYRDLRIWLHELPEDLDNRMSDNIAEWERIIRQRRKSIM